MTAAAIAVAFLQQLRPGGPWVLSAAEPERTGITTITAATEAEVAAFVRRYDGKRNIYYSPNPTRRAMTKKAKKVDLSAIEYLPADLDPRPDETAEAAKQRYLALLETWQPTPTVLVDSGNGIQELVKLEPPIDLSRWQPVMQTDAEGRTIEVLAPKAAAVVRDVEERVKAQLLALGGTAGTQNVDRIMRLPGTTNLPNAKKRKEGRVPCRAKLLHFNGATCRLADLPLPSQAPREDSYEQTSKPRTAGVEVDDGDEIAQLIRDGGTNPSRSEVVWRVVNELLRRGQAPDTIVAILLDRENGISEHVYDQAQPEAYARRQVEQAMAKLEFTVDQHGRPFTTEANIRIALLKLGVTLRYDHFADQLTVTGLAGFGPALTDAALDRMWITLAERFRLRPSQQLFTTVVMDTARRNSFHPVRDYLDGLVWDGTPRIDKWLTTYGGAEHAAYTSAVGALMLIAAVHRVRSPGCKFDEMLVLEDANQGTNKSSALAVLAVKESWFSDDLPLNASGKQVIEALRSRWIVEASEMAGMRRSEIEHVKALLSRTHDRARMAYDRLVTDAPRQCIIIGTTNSEEYLRDTTGNRRFWPVRITGFKLRALKRDRDQLWAEAAALESEGASIRLKRELWPLAEQEQAQRLTSDPYYDALQHALGEYEGKIGGEDVWRILDTRPGQRTQDQNARIGAAMRRLGWGRANKSNTVKIDGKLVVGFVKGEKPWRKVSVVRSEEDGSLQVTSEAEDPEEAAPRLPAMPKRAAFLEPKTRFKPRKRG